MCTRATGAPRLPPARVGECVARTTRPPSPRHAGCIAREKEGDRARGQPARRGFPPRLWHEHREIATSARPTLAYGRAAHVGLPKTRLWPTPARAFVARALLSARSSRDSRAAFYARAAAGAAKPSLGRTGIRAPAPSTAQPLFAACGAATFLQRDVTFPPRRGRCAGGARPRPPPARPPRAARRAPLRVTLRRGSHPGPRPARGCGG